MANRKKIRERGKLRFSEYFKELKVGETIALKREQTLPADFPSRMQGNTGTVVGKQGRSYIVKVKDFNREKTFIVPAIHLKRITLKAKEKN